MGEYEVLVQGPPDACWKNTCYPGMEAGAADRVESSCLGGTTNVWFLYYDGGAE